MTTPAGSIKKFMTPVNQNPPKPPDEADDATVQSGKTTSRPTVGDTWQEMCIKLQMTSKAAITTSDVANKMTQVLRIIHDEFGSKIKIKNNKNKTIQNFKFDEPEDFAKNYKIHNFRPYKPQSGLNRACILFRVCTNQSLSTIRKSSTVAAALQHTSSRLVFYPWTEDVADVQSIGFFVGPLPKYQTTDAFEKSLVSVIAQRASIPAKRIPKFHCVLENITTPIPNSQLRYRCQAFAIQVERHNIDTMQQIL